MTTTIAADRLVTAAASPPADVSTPAVVLKFDPNVMHHGGLGAIRSLGRMGVPVYAVQESAWAPAGHSRYLRGKVLWRPAGLAVDRVRAGLLRLAELIGRPSVLIPTDDAGAIFLAEHGAALQGKFLFPDPPASLPRQLAGKYSLHMLCAELGFPSPRSCVPSSLTRAAEAAADYRYPVVGKLARPWQSQSKQPSTQIIHDQAELDVAWQASQAGQAGLLLQEYIPAAPGHDWFFHGYAAASDRCWPACTGVKDRSYPAHAGLTSFGRCVPNEALRDSATLLLRRLGYRGIADLDLRLDDRDGQYKLLDFNPRLGAQFRLFTGPGGLDLVRAAYLDLTGQPVTGADTVSGRSFMVESYDPLTAISYWRRGELSLRAWLAAMRTVDETAWFARDDLRPFELMCLRMGWRVLTRPLVRAAAARSRSDTADPDNPTEPRLRRGRSKAGRTRTGRQPTSSKGDKE
jgi:predicted ATP-grasp superfamily ATP-dependent carboligase